jgi:hypothetical protein
MMGSEARRRLDGFVAEPDPWFSVGAKRDGASELAASDFILEVLPHAEYVKVIFVDQHHTQRFAYGFKKLDGRMFMRHVTESRYLVSDLWILTRLPAGPRASRSNSA